VVHVVLMMINYSFCCIRTGADLSFFFYLIFCFDFGF
jgi:hypothetical protein